MAPSKPRGRKPLGERTHVRVPSHVTEYNGFKLVTPKKRKSRVNRTAAASASAPSRRNDPSWDFDDLVIPPGEDLVEEEAWMEFGSDCGQSDCDCGHRPPERFKLPARDNRMEEEDNDNTHMLGPSTSAPLQTRAVDVAPTGLAEHASQVFQSVPPVTFQTVSAPPAYPTIYQNQPGWASYDSQLNQYPVRAPAQHSPDWNLCAQQAVQNLHYDAAIHQQILEAVNDYTASAVFRAAHPPALQSDPISASAALGDGPSGGLQAPASGYHHSVAFQDFQRRASQGQTSYALLGALTAPPSTSARSVQPGHTEVCEEPFPEDSVFREARRPSSVSISTPAADPTSISQPKRLSELPPPVKKKKPSKGDRESRKAIDPPQSVGQPSSEQGKGPVEYPSIEAFIRCLVKGNAMHFNLLCVSTRIEKGLGLTGGGEGGKYTDISHIQGISKDRWMSAPFNLSGDDAEVLVGEVQNAVKRVAQGKAWAAK